MAYPVFPGLPPPPTIYEKIIKGFKTEEEEVFYAKLSKKTVLNISRRTKDTSRELTLR